MKTVEEYIKEKYEFPEYCMDDLADQIQAKRTAFKCGVLFAQRWIPIEEEMPTEFEKQLLVKNENYNYVDLRFFNHKNQFDLLCKIHNYTHWRPVSFL